MMLFKDDCHQCLWHLRYLCCPLSQSPASHLTVLLPQVKHFLLKLSILDHLRCRSRVSPIAPLRVLLFSGLSDHHKSHLPTTGSYCVQGWPSYLVAHFGNLILKSCCEWQDWTSTFTLIMYLLYNQNYTHLVCTLIYQIQKNKQTKTLAVLFQASWSQSRFNLHWSMATACLNSKLHFLISKMIEIT